MYNCLYSRTVVGNDVRSLVHLKCNSITSCNPASTNRRWLSVYQAVRWVWNATGNVLHIPVLALLSQNSYCLPNWSQTIHWQNRCFHLWWWNACIPACLFLPLTFKAKCSQTGSQNTMDVLTLFGNCSLIEQVLMSVGMLDFTAS